MEGEFTEDLTLFGMIGDVTFEEKVLSENLGMSTKCL
jgi:hypothetical protein